MKKARTKKQKPFMYCQDLNNFSFKKHDETQKPSNNNYIKDNEHQESIIVWQQESGINLSNEPYQVWDHKDKKYIIDGRFDEYRYSIENDIEVTIMKHHFKNIGEARMFMMLHLLKKPQFNAAQRCLMALKFEKDIAKKAAKNKGKRTDLMDDQSRRFKKINTASEISKLANVGEQYVKQFRKVLKDSPKAFGKEKSNEYIAKIVTEETSVNAVYRKLQDKLKIEKDKADLINNNKDDLFNKANDTENEEATGSIFKNSEFGKDFQNKIICGNNLEVLKKIPDNSVSLIFGSPDYNVDKINYDIDIPLQKHSDHVEKIAEVAKECYRIARNGARMVINIASTRPPEADRADIFETFIVHDLISAFEKLDIGWKKRNVIIWNKRCEFQQKPKGYSSAKNPYFTANHEYLIVFSKGSWEATPEIEGAPSDLTRQEYSEWGQSVWNIVPQSKDKGDHPCPFPSKLVERVIKMLSFPGDLVLDPYLGTGTTSAVAAGLGRRWFGCDISPKYCYKQRKEPKKLIRSLWTVLRISMNPIKELLNHSINLQNRKMKARCTMT